MLRKAFFLFPEQIALIVLMGILLFWASGWGLLDSKRLEILTYGITIDSQLKRNLTEQRDDFYARLESIRKEQSEDVAQRLAQGHQIELGEWGQVPEKEMTQLHKTTAFRAYLLGSAAMDERNTYRALSRIKPSSLDFDPNFYMYGGSYLYLVGGLIYLGKIAGLIQVNPELAWYLEHPTHIARLYLVGRGVNIVAFLGILVLMALWSRRLGSRLMGFLAMLTWSLAWLSWWETLVSKPHVYAAFWSLWCLFLLDGWVKDKKAWRIWLAGAALGMTMGASLPTAALALAFPVFIYGKGNMWFWLRYSLLGWLVASGVFLLTNPYAIVNHEVYLLTVIEHLSGGGWEYGTIDWGSPFVFLKLIIFDVFPFPLMLIGLASILVITFYHHGSLTRLARLLLILLFVWSLTVVSVRIGIFLLAPLCIFAGYSLEKVLFSSKPMPSWLTWCVMVLLLLPGLISLSVQAKAAMANDLWYEPAKVWLESDGLSPNAGLGVYEPPDPTRLPPFPFLNRRVVMLDDWEKDQKQPEVLILNGTEYEQLWHQHQLYRHYEVHTRLGRVPCPDWLGYFMVQCPRHAYSNAMVLRLK